MSPSNTPVASTELPRVSLKEPLEPGAQIVTSVGVLEPGKAALFELKLPPLKDGEFRVKTLYSGFSAGTEMTQLRGTNVVNKFGIDPETRIFNTGKGSGDVPMQSVPIMGYMQVATVMESKTSQVKVGDTVCTPYGHRTEHNVPETNHWIHLPSHIEPLLGVFVGQMGPICAQGVMRADIALLSRELADDPASFAERRVPTLREPKFWARHFGQGIRGKNVLVFGAGIVGLMSALFAKKFGAREVAVVDQVSSRLALVEQFGLTPVNGREVDVARWAKTRAGWGETPDTRGADVALQCTASDAALQTATAALRRMATVVDLGFYQGGASHLHLGNEFHHNGIGHVCAQIQNLPAGITRRDLSELTIALLSDDFYASRLKAHVITDVVPYRQAQSLFDRLLANDLTVVQGVLDFQKA
jgi:threonine dehydrogenase-like Zn-dependent dehydrogenase